MNRHIGIYKGRKRLLQVALVEFRRIDMLVTTRLQSVFIND